MAIVFASNVIEIAVIQTVSGRPAVNVWHMYHDQELTGGDKESVVRDFANNWQDHVTLMQTSNVVLQGFEWRSLDPSDGSLGELAPDGNKPSSGGYGLEPCPPNVAYLVKKNTSNRPRGTRDGRMFLAGVPEDSVDGAGNLLPALVTEAQARLDSFYNGISDTGTVVGGWDGDSYPVVLETTESSRAPGNASVTINSRRVTSLTLDTLVSTQRDRLR